MAETITKEVWSVIKSDLSMQRDMERGVINHRALARHILEKYGVKASLAAVISAIRRYEPESFVTQEKKITNLFKDSLISTKNNIVCFTVEKDAMQAVGKLLLKGVKVLTGTEEIKVFTSTEKAESFRVILSENIKKENSGLSELSITISEAAAKTRGVLARISTEIALHNINIEETIICPPEFIIYVKQKDIVRIYDVLLKLSSG